MARIALYHLVFTALLLCLVASPIQALTPDERQALRNAADEADEQLFFLDEKTLPEQASTDTWLLFYGAKWCIWTQRLTPKWLQVQAAAKEYALDGRGVHLAKVECSVPGETGHSASDFCQISRNITQGFPTLNLYVNGQFVEEYPYENEPEAILQYLNRTASKYGRAKKVEPVPLAELPPPSRPAEQGLSGHLAPLPQPAPPAEQPQSSQPSAIVLIALFTFLSLAAFITYRARRQGADSDYKKSGGDYAPLQM
ncbi:hypothetical protein DFS34DRAFT_390539 [Phlyctochytrium arcticum]|nr:hypothetical protein DFS34DRAFT_390539 [Phlyctochytrium arcticum]